MSTSRTSSTGPKSGGRFPALEGLKGITVKGLAFDHVHRGKVLYGHLCQEPIMRAELHTKLEDEFGTKVCISIDNAAPYAMASIQECEAPFPMGLKVAIKEPHYVKWEPRGGLLRVSNPGKIVPIPNYKEKDEAKVLELLEGIRGEGNKLFGMEDWVGAVARYSECIDVAVGVGEAADSRSESLNNVMNLVYSNRAEALLQLKDFLGALCDTERALELNPTHSKSLSRQGRAAMQIGLYEKALKAFEAALQLCPNDASTAKHLQASRKCLQQSRREMSKNPSLKLPADTSKEYLGPVEIRRVNYNDGRRGMFAKESIQAYSVVIRAPAMAVSRTEPGNGSTGNLDSSGGFRASFGYGNDRGLLVKLLQLVETSRHNFAQLCSLAGSGDGEKEVPSMELFKPGSQWAPPSAHTLELNVNCIKRIVQLNVFTNEDEAVIKGGLWILQSFLNHSCVPNCIQVYEDNIGSIRTLRDIGRDEELTLGYFVDMFSGFERRHQYPQPFPFTCECERCLLEKQLKPEFTQIRAQVDNLFGPSKTEFQPRTDAERRIDEMFKSYMTKAEAEVPLGPRGRLMQTKQLADLAVRVEALIQSLGKKVATRQRKWIRGGFLEAYLAKYMLIRELEPQSSARIDILSVIVKSMIEISPSASTLLLAQLLVHEVRGRYGDDSEFFRKTKDLVLHMNQGYFGVEMSAQFWHAMLSAPPAFDYCDYSFALP